MEVPTALQQHVLCAVPHDRHAALARRSNVRKLDNCSATSGAPSRRGVEERTSYARWRRCLRAANIVLFAPLGFLLPCALRSFRRAWPTLLLAAGLSVLIETTQALLPGHSTDVDDVILNSAGAALGYLAFARSIGRDTEPGLPLPDPSVTRARGEPFPRETRGVRCGRVDKPQPIVAGLLWGAFLVAGLDVRWSRRLETWWRDGSGEVRSGDAPDSPDRRGPSGGEFAWSGRRGRCPDEPRGRVGVLGDRRRVRAQPLISWGRRCWAARRPNGRLKTDGAFVASDCRPPGSTS